MRQTLLIDTGSYLPVLFVSETGDVAPAGPRRPRREPTAEHLGLAHPPG